MMELEQIRLRHGSSQRAVLGIKPLAPEARIMPLDQTASDC